MRAVQRKETNKVCSIPQSVCVSLVLALAQRQRINLIFSTNRSDCRTTKQLALEILYEIKRASGRINLFELPALLSVERKHIDSVIPDVVNDNIIIAGNDLISKQHLDLLFSAIPELLELYGHLNLEDYARDINLPVSLVKEQTASRISDGSINAVLFNYTIYTEDFVTVQEHLLEGALLGCLEPVSIRTLISEFHVIASIADSRMFLSSCLTFADAIEKWKTESRFPGEFIGNGCNSTYSPWVRSVAQRFYLSSFLQTNGYLSRQRMHEISPSTTFSSLQSMFTEYTLIELDSVIISKEHFIQPAVDTILFSLDKDSVCDIKV